jgi:hypothetical protein
MVGLEEGQVVSFEVVPTVTVGKVKRATWSAAVQPPPGIQGSIFWSRSWTAPSEQASLVFPQLLSVVFIELVVSTMIAMFEGVTLEPCVLSAVELAHICIC